MTTYPYLLFEPIFTGEDISGKRPIYTINARNPDAAIALATRLRPDRAFLWPACSTYFLRYRAQATGLPHLNPADFQATLPFLPQEKPACALHAGCERRYDHSQDDNSILAHQF